MWSNFKSMYTSGKKNAFFLVRCTCKIAKMERKDRKKDKVAFLAREAMQIEAEVCIPKIHAFLVVKKLMRCVVIF